MINKLTNRELIAKLQLLDQDAVVTILDPDTGWTVFVLGVTQETYSGSIEVDLTVCGYKDMRST